MIGWSFFDLDHHDLTGLTAVPAIAADNSDFSSMRADFKDSEVKESKVTRPSEVGGQVLGSCV